MSYIPKYILKRMIPKDAVSIDGDDIVVAMTNVISPISIDEIPEDVLNYLEVKVDGDIVISGDQPEAGKSLRIKWEDKTFTLDNIDEAIGETLPVGGKMTIMFKNPGLKSGDTHEFEVTIKADNPINIKFKRAIQ